jgi:hypothetical protein
VHGFFFGGFVNRQKAAQRDEACPPLVAGAGQDLDEAHLDLLMLLFQKQHDVPGTSDPFFHLRGSCTPHSMG